MSDRKVDEVLSYTEIHDRFAAGKFMGVDGKRQNADQWERFVNRLNALGPKKLLKAWRAVSQSSEEEKFVYLCRTPDSAHAKKIAYE